MPGEQMNKKEIEAILNRMVQVSGEKNVSGMLRATSIASSAASGWRKRSNVPAKGIAKVAEKYGANYHWLLTGEGVATVTDHAGVSGEINEDEKLDYGSDSSSNERHLAHIYRRLLKANPEKAQALYQHAVDELLKSKA